MSSVDLTKAELIEQLELLRQQKRALFDDAGDASVAMDVRFVIQAWNRTAESLYGWTSREAIGRRMTDLVPIRYEGTDTEQVRETILRDGRWAGEAVQTRKDGADIRVRVSFGIVKDDAGHPTGVIAVTRDVTDLREAQEKISRFGRMLEDAHNEIYAFDAETLRFVEVNLGARQNLGYSMEELRKLTPLDLKPEFTPKSFAELLEPLRQGTQRRRQFTTVHRRKDGSLYPVEVHLQRVTGVFVAILLDITERRAVEREREQHLGNIKERVKELRGLYGMARAATEAQSLHELFLSACELVPSAWQHTDVCRCRVVFDGEEYVGEPFEPSAWKQTADLVVGGVSRGAIEVHYIEERPASAEGPFLAEERSLIDTLAHILASAIAHRETTDALVLKSHIVEASPAAAFLWRNEEGWPVDYVSENASSLFGHAAHAFRSGSVPYSTVIHPDDLERVASEVASFSADDGRLRFEHEPYRIVTKEGAVKWVDDRTVIRRDASGQITHYQGVVLDITERMKAEEALRQSDERLRAVLSAMSDFLFVLDRDHRIEMINRLGMGQRREELIGLPIYDLAPPEERDRIRAMLDLVVRERVSQQFDGTYVRPDGETRQFSSVAAPIVVSDEVVGSVVNSRDVTERRQLELELKRLEEQYQQSQKMESIGRLAGGVAHDFNNSITVINSFAQFVADGLRKGDPMLDDIREVQTAGRRAAALTRQLLAFSRKQVMDPRVLDLNEIVSDMERMLKRLIGEDVTLSVHLAEDLGAVKVDPGQMEHVVMNLAVNARDAMPTGGTLTIETANAEPSQVEEAFGDAAAGPMVLLCVSDEGVGITEEVKERMYEPFFTTKQRGEGTGLGLSMVYGIVKQSGGDIAVVTSPGQGSTFKVCLPRVQEAGASRTPKGEGVVHGGTETVLLVEDEDAVRALAKRILTRAGYSVVAVASGGEALLAYEQQASEIRLVLTDVVMPKMSGRELADRLKKIEPGLKVLYMSGYTDDAIADHGVLRGGAQLITKPFSPDQLMEKVRSVLDGSD